MTKYKNNHK